jgi:hypothetical protein
LGDESDSNTLGVFVIGKFLAAMAVFEGVSFLDDLAQGVTAQWAKTILIHLLVLSVLSKWPNDRARLKLVDRGWYTIRRISAGEFFDTAAPNEISKAAAHEV